MATVGRVLVTKLLTAGHAELFADQIQARDFFGDTVFDLQSGIDLQKRDRAVLANQKLTGTSADVVGFLQ